MEVPGIYAQDTLNESEVIARFTEQSSDTASSPEQSEPALSPEHNSDLGITNERLDTLIQNAIAAAVSLATQPLNEQLASLQTQLAESQQHNQSLEQVFRVLNVSPNPAIATPTGRDGLQGLASDFATACESAPSAVWVNRNTGERFVQRDLSQARHLFFTQRDQLRLDMQKMAIDSGFLRGGQYASDAPTVRANIPPALLDYLSLVLRETHCARYVYWQFPFYQLELGKGPGDTIQVARFRWLTEPSSVSDRTLTPGTNLSGSSQNIAAAAVSIVLGERGLGSGVPATSLPVAVPEFLIATSMLNLENAVMSRLGHDYEVYEDLSIRTRYFATTRVVYNDRQSVTTSPLSIAAGDDGTLTENFLNNLYAYMSGAQIPPLDDGCYVLVVHDIALAQYKNSLAARSRYIDPINMAELTMLLQAATNKEMGRTSGYAGKMNGFHIFATNAHSMGVAGTEGVQLETLAVGVTLTRTSFAFGRAAVARAIGMEAEMRRDTNDDFGRLNRWTWVSHETTGDLDVDPAINAEQQLKVIEIHTLDVVV